MDGDTGGDLLVRVSNVDVSFGPHKVLDDVSLAVHAGEIVSLIGPNGSGKTTLVRVVLGLLAPDRGRVHRRKGLTIGYMPQRLPVDETLPLTVAGFLRLGGPVAAADMRATLDEVGAGPLINSQLRELSGGELRRVVLARALLRDPQLLVLDEPVQGVDITGQAELHRLITRVRERHGCGVLMISHDLHVVMADTDRVVCLNHHVCCTGRPEAVSRDPAYRTLFGPQTAEALAVYSHHHDHRHDQHGEVVPPPGTPGPHARGPEPEPREPRRG